MPVVLVLVSLNLVLINNKMKNKIAIVLGVLIGLVVVVSTVFGLYVFTGNVVQQDNDNDFDYKHTKAICDGNECRDYNITCKDGKALRIDPVSGMVIFQDDWEDSRTEEDRELCG